MTGIGAANGRLSRFWTMRSKPEVHLACYHWRESPAGAARPEKVVTELHAQAESIYCDELDVTGRTESAPGVHSSRHTTRESSNALS